MGWRRCRPMAMLAVSLAAFAPRLLGVVLGLASRKRRRLSFGGAFGKFKAFLEIAHGLLQLLNGAITLGELFAQLIDKGSQFRVRRSFHAHLDRDKPCQLSKIVAVFAWMA